MPLLDGRLGAQLDTTGHNGFDCKEKDENVLTRFVCNVTICEEINLCRFYRCQKAEQLCKKFILQTTDAYFAVSFFFIFKHDWFSFSLAFFPFFTTLFSLF